MLPFAYILIFVFFFLYSFLRTKKGNFRKRHDASDDAKIVGIFHPFCNSRGGGERVLWCAVKAIQEKWPNCLIVIYSDRYEESEIEILSNAKQTFHIDADFRVQFIRLDFCFLLSAKYYPILTLLFQNLFSTLLGLQAVLRCPPDIFIDTMGVSFVYPLFRLISKSRVITYTHYPIISTDMLSVVNQNVESFNNRKWIARRKCCHVVMVNSSWTSTHIRQIWSTNVKIVYPPCNTENLKKYSLSSKKPGLIISMAQFRPEKNHKLQLEAFKYFIQMMNKQGANIDDLEFHIIGSCRNSDDFDRMKKLEEYSKELGINEWVKFRVNLPYRDMEELMGRASIALHTMINEHFGISVVEFLAAGIVTISHRSGGPLMDIIKENETGFFAESKEEFGKILFDLRLRKSLQQIRENARESVERFSEKLFCERFVHIIEHVM